MVRTVKVLHLEHRRARFSSGTLQLGRVDLGKAILVEMVSEQLADARLNPEDGLVGRCLVSFSSGLLCVRLAAGRWEFKRYRCCVARSL